MPPQQKRQTAKLISGEEAHSGKYFEKEGFTPNYLLTTSGRRISRARITGTVTEEFTNDDETYGSLTIDDGTDTIQLKFFSDLGLMQSHSEGETVEAIGKVREYQGEIYLNAEKLSEVPAKKQVLHILRLEKMHLEFKQKKQTVVQMKESGKDQEEIEKEMKGSLEEEEVDAILQSLNEEFSGESDEERENLEKKIIEAVEDLDNGDGADYGDISERVDANEDELESSVNSLLSEGTFYEPQPGKIKKL